MRHLHFTQSLEPLQGGGLGRAALDLHLQLLQDGFASRLITTRSREFDRMWPETFQYPRTGPQKAFFARDLGRDSNTAVSKADVVHGHGFYVYTNWAVGSRARAKRKPLVYHPHGMLEPWILQRSRWKKRVAGFLFERHNMQACRLWRALTSREADQIRHQGFSAPIVVAPNGVPLSDYDVALPVSAPRQLALPERARERKRLVFMARLHPKKGLNLLIPAWAKLNGQRAGWELLIAGPDENGHRASVTKMIQELGVSSCTTLVGPVTGAAKLELLKSADLFVLPSHSEGFPVSVLEAMACRVPVIGTDACNFAELETEGGGWLCEANHDSVLRALEAALHSSAAERKSRGETARKLVEQRYSWPAISATIRAACESHCN
jgi:glycosyltransferase involved in cell wall biosynthesis